MSNKKKSQAWREASRIKQVSQNALSSFLLLPAGYMLEITLEMMTSGNKGLLSKLRALPYHSTLYLNSCIMTFCTKRSFTQDFDLADCDCITLFRNSLAIFHN